MVWGSGGQGKRKSNFHAFLLVPSQALWDSCNVNLTSSGFHYMVEHALITLMEIFMDEMFAVRGENR
jgi:hypothetical protein